MSVWNSWLKYSSKDNIIKNKILKDTQCDDKEIFESIFKNSRKTLLEINIYILEEFDIEKAKSRNDSFNTFLENAIWLF